MKRTALTLLVPFCLLQFVLAQEQPKLVDYTTVAVPLERALSELSQQTGSKLFVDQGLRDEIIVLRLKGALLEDVKQRIATVVGAEWKKTPDGFELYRSAEMATQLNREAVEARAKNIQEALEAKRAQIRFDTPLTAQELDRLAAQFNLERSSIERDGNQNDYDKLVQMQASMPGARALWRVLAAIDPKRLAEIGLDQRVVFSNQPTKTQVEIGSDLSKVGEQLFEENNGLSAAYQKLNPGESSVLEGYGIDPIASYRAEPVRFVLSARREIFGDAINLHLIAFDGSGGAVMTSRGTLQLIGNLGKLQAERARMMKEAETEPDLPISPATKGMLEFMRKVMGGGVMEAATGALRDALLHPETIDPLATAASEAFLGIADLRNENLVFCPDDSMFLIAMFAGQEGKFKPSLVMQGVSGLGQVSQANVEEKDGWMLVSPTDRLQTYQSRTDRRALGEFMRSFDEKGYVPIEASALLAKSIRGSSMPMLDIFFPMLLSPDARPEDRGELRILKLYAELGPEMIRRMYETGGVRVAELNREQLRLVSDYFYQKEGGVSRMIAPGKPRPSFAELAASGEPTEILPDGMSLDATIGFSARTQKTFIARVSNGGSQYVTAMPMDTIAWTLSLKDHPEEAPSTYQPTILSLSPGEERTIGFDLSIARGKEVHSDLKETRLLPGGPWSLNHLPDDLKKELSAALAKVNASHVRGTDGPAPKPQTKPPL